MKFADDEHLTPVGIWLKRKLQRLIAKLQRLIAKLRALVS